VYVGSNDHNLYSIGQQPTTTPTRTPTGTPTATPSPTAVPQAEMRLSGSSCAPGDYFSATFRLNDAIARPFTAFAVVMLPGGGMLDALSLGSDVKPVASNVPRLDPLSYPLISLNLPMGAPVGEYEVVAAFFDPSRPITGRADAFLDAGEKFVIR
jgi:hypothetical protein